MLAVNYVLNGGGTCTVFRPLGSLELVGDFVLAHVCDFLLECLGTDCSLAEGKRSKIID